MVLVSCKDVTFSNNHINDYITLFIIIYKVIQGKWNGNERKDIDLFESDINFVIFRILLDFSILLVIANMMDNKIWLPKSNSFFFFIFFFCTINKIANFDPGKLISFQHQN